MRRFHDAIARVAGSVVTVRALGVGYQELAIVSGAETSSLAQVVRMDGELVSLQVFSGTRGVSTGDRVRFLGEPMRVPCSDQLLGRVFDGAGRPRDGRARPEGELVELNTPAVNPVRRKLDGRMIRTGIPMIDVFNSLVESQKLPIFSVPGEPYNELLARIGLQAHADVVVFGGMGLRHDDYLTFRAAFEEGGVASRSIMFVHTAAEATVECIMVPDLCLAVAEQLALAGRRVLVLLTDMTAYADALKEMAITMEQIPSNRGYPGDLYTQLACRYEKAVEFEGAGSVTILACVTMPGDDITHPVPDNTGYITEGQFYLRHGRIEPFGSLSRLKQIVNGDTRDDHRAIMDACIRLYAGALESREKQSMGFETTPWDARLLAYAVEFERRIMDLSVDVPLEDALDRCWEILATHFEPVEVGIRQSVLAAHWPGDGTTARAVEPAGVG